MTNEELLEDLKQFVAATVSQATAGLATQESVDKLDTKLSKQIADVKTELSNQIADLDAKVDTIAVTQAESIEDDETLLTRLEQSAA